MELDLLTPDGITLPLVPTSFEGVYATSGKLSVRFLILGNSMLLVSENRAGILPSGDISFRSANVLFNDLYFC